MAALPPRQPQDLIQLLTRAERLLSRHLAATVEEAGCSMEAWRVISLLAEGDGRYMTDIAEHAFLAPGTLTKLVDQLVDDNLVYRRIDEADRRRIRAQLTPRGRRLHQRVSDQVEQRLAALALADSDRELLGQLLSRVVASLDHHSIAAS